MSQKTRRWAFIVGALLVTAAAVSSLLIYQNTSANGGENTKSAGTKAEELPVPVEVATAELGSVSSFLESSTTLEAEKSADVLAKTDGLLTSVRVAEGDTVREGQVLAVLDDTEKKLALEKAKLKLAKAEAEYQRAKLAFDQKLVSQHDYEKARFDRDLAASEVETSELELRYTEVRAPFSGRITERMVVQGKTLKKGDPLFTMADFSSITARLYLPERDVTSLRTGQPVEIVLQALATTSFKARIRDISPVVDPKTGTVKVTAEIGERSPAIRPGAFVQARIVTDTHAGAVLVPKVAVLREDRDDFVFVVDTAKALKRKVTLGYGANGAVEVRDGVKAGDRVVVAGQSSLKDESRIEILK